jgi:hypothetical protein
MGASGCVSMNKTGHSLAAATFALLAGLIALFGRSKAGLLEAAFVLAIPAMASIIFLRRAEAGSRAKAYFITLAILAGLSAIAMFVVGLTS